MCKILHIHTRAKCMRCLCRYCNQSCLQEIVKIYECAKFARLHTCKNMQPCPYILQCQNVRCLFNEYQITEQPVCSQVFCKCIQNYTQETKLEPLLIPNNFVDLINRSKNSFKNSLLKNLIVSVEVLLCLTYQFRSFIRNVSAVTRYSKQAKEGAVCI